MTRDISQATVHKDKVRPSSAVSRWSMDSSDVSSGVISDSWGSNNGTLNGGVSTGVSGVGGSEAFSFDGSTGEIDVGDVSSLDFGSEDFSISFWARAQNNGIVEEFVNKEIGGGTTTGYFIRNDSGDLHFQTYDGSSGNTLKATGEVIVGQWAHYVAIRSQGKYKKLYVNGVEAASSGSSAGDLSNSAPFTVAARNSSDLYFKGSIDELRIYSEALNQQQIWKLYNIGRNANWGYSRS